MTSIRSRMSRQRILDGAWRILDSGSANDLTVDAIARALHMSKSTLYKYFTSKEDVVVGLVEAACDATDARARAAAREIRGAARHDAVARVLDLYAVHAEQLPRAVLLEPEKLPAACLARLEQTWRELHDVARSAIGEGAGQDELAATALSTSARAAVVAAAGGRIAYERGHAARSLRPLFLNGLAALTTV